MNSSHARILALTALLCPALVSCSHKSRKAAAPAQQAAGPDTPKQDIPKQDIPQKDAPEQDQAGETQQTAQMPTEEPATKMPVPVQPMKSTVFFISHLGDLVPLGCYDFQKRKIDGRDPCLALVPQSSQLRLGTGNLVPVTQRTRSGCSVEQEARIGALSVQGEVEDDTYAVWPESAAARIAQVVDIKDQEPLSVEDERLLAQTVLRAAKGQRWPFTLQQLVSVDIDGDGRDDRLYVTSAEGKNLTVFGGLFLQRGGAPGKMEIVLWRKSEDVELPVQLLGTMDLDGDGKRELWLVEHVSPSSMAKSVARYADGKFQVIGKLSCSNY